MPWPTEPANIARSLAAHATAWFWLDGAATTPGEARFSLLGAAAEVRVATRGSEREFLAGLRASAVVGDAVPPGSAAVAPGGGFQRGWVVALAYEFGVALLGVTPAFDDEAPGVALRANVVLRLDHDRREAELCGESSAELDAWWSAHGPAWTQPAAAAPASIADTTTAQIAPRVPPGSTSTTSTPRWLRGAEDYAASVRACLDAITAGEAYVLCLTDRAETRASPDPLELFLRLRARGPSLRGGVLAWEDRALVSASPERFLTVADREVRTHPIKGTRPRDPSPEADRALAAELAADPKERAENLMIVDLMRNDLSRVCVPGTIDTRGFLRVEAHPHVHQLVSTVAGTLRPERDAVDALLACFPGGSMTGAPKRRAVQLLADLEGVPRGLYSGCFGWLDDGGDAELAMTIRSVEVRGRGGPNPRAWVGAGGGITADSDPAREERERRLKADPLLAALAGA